MRYTVWTRGSFVTPQISDPARVSEMQLVGLQGGGRGGLIDGGDVFYLVFLSPAPDIYVFVCICSFFFFFQDTLNQLAGSISGILQPIVSR